MFYSPKLSLADLLGEEYLQAVAGALDALGVLSRREALELARERVDFYPEALQRKNDGLLEKVGRQVAPPFENQNNGAATDAFRKAAHNSAAPLTGLGNYRVGEDGRLYLIGKSEHYQASLGHRFQGYRLIDNARRLGILNATHNNTRGYITRTLERRLVAAANGIQAEGPELEAVLGSREPGVLNRVINLETGSLACEAGIKMMLTRFYRLDGSFEQPKYAGKTPVFLVMEDGKGKLEANYHGTSVTAQTFRGLWPEFTERLEAAGIYRVVPVKINDIGDFEEKLTAYNRGEYKTAGFLHELVLMNYGGVRLDDGYIQEAHRLCRRYDTPTMVDEIQSCMWYKGMFLFRLYGLRPDFVTVGKGFPGGEYPASKILTTAGMDTLNQFGALVTNGQEELASLSYLITMAFSQANGEEIAALGSLFENGLRRLGSEHAGSVCRVEGQGHLAALHFHDVDTAARFASLANGCCIDTSVQIYKPNCPPAVLLKPPVIASQAVLEYILEKLEQVLRELEESRI